MRYRNKEHRAKFNSYKCKKRDIKRIYDNEKEKYINNENLDIDIEKLNLKSCLNNINNELIILYLTILVISIVTFISLIFVVIINFDSLVTIALTSILLIDLSLILLFLNRKMIKKTLAQQLYYEICLKVLNTIERETKTNIEKHILKQ